MRADIGEVEGIDANERNTSRGGAGFVPAPWPIWGAFLMAAITVTALAASHLLSLGPGTQGLYFLVALLVGLYGTALGLATFLRVALVADVVAVVLAVSYLFVR